MNYSVGMQRGVKKGSKFRVQSEIALFSVLQQHGRLSVSELAKRVNLARTAAYYAQKRLWARGLFDFRYWISIFIVQSTIDNFQFPAYSIYGQLLLLTAFLLPRLHGHDRQERLLGDLHLAYPSTAPG